MTVAEVARGLSCSKRYVQELARTGRLRAKWLGSEYRFEPADVEAYRKSLPVVGQPMDRRKKAGSGLRAILGMALACLLLPAAARGEMFVEGFGGLNLNTVQGLSTDGAQPFKYGVVTNPVYGVRVGGWGEYLGAQVQYLHASPGLKQTALTHWPSQTKVPLLGRRLDLEAFFLSGLVRYPHRTLEPFLGAGVGYLRATLGGNACEDLPGNCGLWWPVTGGAQQTAALAGTLQAGALWRMSEQWGLTLTWQLLISSLTFDGFPNKDGQPPPPCCWPKPPNERLELLLQTVQVGLRYQFE
jgi:excisionase family DNA binding protein